MPKRRRNAVSHFLSQLFHRRNIIILSDKSVDHYPLSGWVQALLAITVVGAFSFISYISGSYMAAQSMLEEKDRKLFSTVMHNQQMDKEYSLLRRDLEKFKDSDGELGDYARHVLEQHTTVTDAEADAALLSFDGSNDVNDMLTKRIAYLEDYVTNLQDENAKIISLVQRRTQGKIKELTDIIEFTGLKVDKVANIAREDLAKDAQAAQEVAKEQAANFAEGSDGGSNGGQGGPLIPEDLTSFGEAFFSDIDEMMLLYSIVDRLPVAEPMKNARRTSTYGRRIDPFTKRWAMHSGMDFAGSYYAPIFATGEGTVIRAGRWGAYGRTVVIDHGYGITTRYGHMKDINVKKGQKVSRGQQIGRQGSSGRSTGQHLHYEVRFNGKALDPEKFLEASSYVKKQQPQG